MLIRKQMNGLKKKNGDICKMKKIIKKYGTSTVIVLTVDDLEVYNLKVGDVVDIELVKSRRAK